MMPGTSHKLRSACDTCSRTKVRCSGGVPCIGCSNSGSPCFYSLSGRLGRPRGTKSKRTTSLDGSNTPRKIPSMTTNETRQSSRSSRETSASPSTEQHKIPSILRQQSSRQQPSGHQMTDNFITNNDDQLSNLAMLDTTICDSTNNIPLNIVDPSSWDMGSFDLSSFLDANMDAHGFSGLYTQVN